MYQWLTAICACADISNLNYSSVKMLLLKTWIRAAKFSLKISISSEDTQEMQTEFQQSGKHILFLWWEQLIKLAFTLNLGIPTV